LAGVRGQSSFVLGLSVAVERISPWPVFGNFSAKARQKLIFQSAFFAKIIIFILGFGVFLICRFSSLFLAAAFFFLRC